jgi:hypothetical protein
MNVSKMIGRLVIPVFFLLAGLGIYSLSAVGGDEVTCGGRVMTASDTCEHTTNGDTSSNTYDKELDNQHGRQRNFRIAGDVVMGLAGLSVLWVLATSFRKERV